MTQHHNPQQPQQAQTGPALEQALQAHAQASGLTLSGVDWGAVTAAILQLIAALARGSGGQATP